MAEFFIFISNFFDEHFILGGFSILALILIALIFLAFFIVWLVKKQLGKKNYITYFLLSASVVFIERTVQTLAKSQHYTLLLFCTIILFFVVLFNLPKRKFIPTQTQLSLARKIDEKVKVDAIEKSSLENQVDFSSEPVKITTKPVTEGSLPEIDFSHVKNVIKRLEYYNLTAVDKRQVSQLENAIRSAENGASDLKTKEGVNEGLGILLKIMSKYGV